MFKSQDLSFDVVYKQLVLVGSGHVQHTTQSIELIAKGFILMHLSRFDWVTILNWSSIDPPLPCAIGAQADQPFFIFETAS